MSSRETSDLLMLAMGSYTPLTGFMDADDWRSCCIDMKTADGLFWPIPITLSCDKELAAGIGIGEDVALVDDGGTIFGVLQVKEKYTIDRELKCSQVYRTTDPAHPGVAKVMGQGEINLAGPSRPLTRATTPETYVGLYLRDYIPDAIDRRPYIIWEGR